ncbi:hypothetical protein AB1Y20_013535 [Prymnesium parvum]|uniref:Uncharacterized protein n=1 Tax=Prymnesium parvum TaxID=97485 RepID=A0AB34IIV9_PRYPA
MTPALRASLPLPSVLPPLVDALPPLLESLATSATQLLLEADDHKAQVEALGVLTDSLLRERAEKEVDFDERVAGMEAEHEEVVLLLEHRVRALRAEHHVASLALRGEVGELEHHVASLALRGEVGELEHHVASLALRGEVGELEHHVASLALRGEVGELEHHVASLALRGEERKPRLIPNDFPSARFSPDCDVRAVASHEPNSVTPESAAAKPCASHGLGQLCPRRIDFTEDEPSCSVPSRCTSLETIDEGGQGDCPPPEEVMAVVERFYVHLMVCMLGISIFTHITQDCQGETLLFHWYEFA